MRVVFDRHAKVAGIALVAWSRLGLEQWFNGYTIASLYPWDIATLPDAPKTVVFANTPAELPNFRRWNTQHLLDNDQFQRVLADRLAGHHIVTYKPVRVPEAFAAAGIKVSCGNQALSQRLENKAEFRKLFSSEGIPFPPYRVAERSTLQPTAAVLTTLLAGREAVVVQDEVLSGGKGTFIIRTLEDLRVAHETLGRLSRSSRVVLSDLVPGARERSVQGVVTQHGIFIGPLQKQIVRHPLLANMHMEGSDRFCGGEIDPDDPLLSVYDEIRGYAQKIGARIQSMGYKGIFGIDCLVDEHGRVFVLEINPRITGLTSLLTQLYRAEQDIPFYLLHTLELAGIPYEMPDISLAEKPATGALFLLHSLATAPIRIASSPASGFYDTKTLAFAQSAYKLGDASPEQVLVQQYMPPEFRIPAGGRVLSAYTPQTILGLDDQLTSSAEDLIKSLHSHIQTSEVG